MYLSMEKSEIKEGLKSRTEVIVGKAKKEALLSAVKRVRARHWPAILG